jgi:hypothetical protein
VVLVWVCHRPGWYSTVYLETRHWAGLKRMYKSEGSRCEAWGCGHRYQLELHHENYALWNESPDDLVVLCRQCHHAHHAAGAPRFEDVFLPKPCCFLPGACPEKPEDWQALLAAPDEGSS